MSISDISVITTAAGILVILTNALTELFKGIFPRCPAQITATIIALLLTVFAVTAYLAITSTPAEWYIIVGAVIAGLFISYTAQHGYDKLQEIIDLIGGKKK